MSVYLMSQVLDRPDPDPERQLLLLKLADNNDEEGLMRAGFDFDPEPQAAPRQRTKSPIPEALRWQVFERDDFTCQTCGSRTMLRADHIIPESKGGPMTLENLQTLCSACNSKKGTTA